MKKIGLSLLILMVSGCLMGCAFLAGVDAPQNLKVHAKGRSVSFSWDEVPEADSYVIQTTGGNKKWEDYAVEGTSVSFDNRINLFNFTKYTFSVCAVKDGMKGPASKNVSIYMAYGYEYNTIRYSRQYPCKSEGVTFTWDNIKPSSSGPYGCAGIEYKIYRLEGTESGIKFFEEDNNAEKVLIADHIKPSSDNADEKLSYTDKSPELTVGKAYQYFVLPYSDECNWEGDCFITHGLQGYDTKYVKIDDIDDIDEE